MDLLKDKPTPRGENLKLFEYVPADFFLGGTREDTLRIAAPTLEKLPNSVLSKTAKV